MLYTRLITLKLYCFVFSFFSPPTFNRHGEKPYLTDKTLHCDLVQRYQYNRKCSLKKWFFFPKSLCLHFLFLFFLRLWSHSSSPHICCPHRALSSPSEHTNAANTTFFRISNREGLNYKTIQITSELLFQDVNICFFVLSCDKLSRTTSVTADGTENGPIKPNRCTILFQKPTVTKKP